YEAGALALLVELAVGLLTFKFFQRRLGIEGIHMRRPAVHEEENDALCPRPEMRRRPGASCKGGLRTDQPGQTQHAEPGAHAAKHLAAREKAVGRSDKKWRCIGFSPHTSSRLSP